MPDEIAQGHAGRLARLNGLVSARAMAGAVRNFADLRDEDTAHQILLKLLAYADDAAGDDYCRHHSIFPHRRIVSTLDPNEFLESQRKLFFRSQLLAHDKPRFCKPCALSDFGKHGFSWYRRRHDIPGIDSCVIHGGVLHQVEAEEPYLLLPHEVLARQSSSLVRDPKERASTAPGFVRNYVRAYLSLGSAESPIEKDSVAMVLLQRSMKLMGGASTQKLSRTVLRQMTVCKAPEDWLQRFSSRQELASGLATINQTRGSPSNEHVALAVAAMFKDPEAAVREFQRVQISPEFSMMKDVYGRQLRKLIRDPSWPSYWRNAAWLGFQISAVQSRNAAGMEWEVIPKLGSLDRSSAWRTLKSFCGGSSLRDACSMHSTEPAEIERFLRGETQLFCALVEKLRELSQHDQSKTFFPLPGAFRRVPVGAGDVLPGPGQFDGENEKLGAALEQQELWLDCRQAGVRLVPGCKRPIEVARVARCQGRILAVFDGMKFRYPVFQFSGDATLSPAIVELMRLMPVKRDGSIAPHVARWIFTPNRALSMRSPAEVFPSRPDRVLKAATVRPPYAA